jgi:hypothetical protein
MGAVLSAGFNPVAARIAGDLPQIREGAAAEALIDPRLREQISAKALVQLRDALAGSLDHIFVVCAIVSGAALLVVLRLPHISIDDRGRHTTADSGERAMMAEFTVVDAEHEPALVEE